MNSGNQNTVKSTVEFRLRKRSRLAAGWVRAVLFVTLMIGGLSAGLAVSTYTMTQANGMLSAAFFNASDSGSVNNEGGAGNPSLKNMCQDTLMDYVF